MKTLPLMHASGKLMSFDVIDIISFLALMFAVDFFEFVTFTHSIELTRLWTSEMLL